MSERGIDDALSEVIGFILIIAIIVILGSLYMTYVVPSEGRDLEIKHMQDVEKFFTDFKMNMDALWLNDQVGVSFNQLLSLGTGGQTSSGVFSIFPIMQPVGSFGRVSVVTDDPIIELTISGYWLDDGGLSTSVDETQIAKPGTILFVNYETEISDPTYPDPNSLTIYSTKGDWSATLEVIDETYLRPGDIEWVEDPDTLAVSNLKISRDLKYSLVLTVEKNGVKTLERLPISSDYTIHDSYSVNLLDEGYGLHDDIQFPYGVNYQYFNNAVPITGPGSPFELIGYDFTEYTTSIPVGHLSYDSSNKYWINQKYIYQLGGVFLEQEGFQSSRIRPWLSVKQKPGYEGGPDIIPEIQLDVLSINQLSGSISAPDSVQLSSKLNSISSGIEYVDPVSGDIYEYYLSNLNPNANRMIIEITSSENDPVWAQSWLKTLSDIMKDSGIDESYYEDPVYTCNPAGCTVTLEINGEFPPSDDTPDLFVEFEKISAEISITGPVYV